MMTSDPDNGPIRNDRPDARLATTEVPDTPGARLRQTRQVKKLDINSVATALHLSRPVVEAIERNDYDQLPSAVFVAGYIRSYARLLGLDPEPLNESFRRLHPGAEAPPRQVVRSARNGGEREHSNLPLYLFVLALLLAVGGGAYLWWMNRPQFERTTIEGVPAESETLGRATSAPGPSAGATPPPETISSPTPTSALDEPTSSDLDNLLRGRDEPGSIAPDDAAGDALGDQLDEPAARTAPPTSATASAAADDLSTRAPAATEDGRSAMNAGERDPLPTPPAPEPRASSGGTVPGETGADDALASAATDASSDADTDASEPAAAEAGSAPGAVALNFTGPCWVDVRDATGEVLLFGEMSRGDREALDGEPPYSLVLGNAAAVEVTVGGERYDIRSIARGNVARFELDPAELAAASTAESE